MLLCCPLGASVVAHFHHHRARPTAVPHSLPKACYQSYTSAELTDEKRYIGVVLISVFLTTCEVGHMIAFICLKDPQ